MAHFLLQDTGESCIADILRSGTVCGGESALGPRNFHDYKPTANSQSSDMNIPRKGEFLNTLFRAIIKRVAT